MLLYLCNKFHSYRPPSHKALTRATWFSLGDWLLPGPQQEVPFFHHYTITDRPRSTRKDNTESLFPSWQYAIYQRVHLTLHKAHGRSPCGTLTFTQSASQEKREAKPNLWNSGTNVMLGIESIHTIPLHQSPQDLAITLTLAKASRFFSTKTKPPGNVCLHTHMHTLPCYLPKGTSPGAIQAATATWDCSFKIHTRIQKNWVGSAENLQNLYTKGTVRSSQDSKNIFKSTVRKITFLANLKRSKRPHSYIPLPSLTYVCLLQLVFLLSPLRQWLTNSMHQKHSKLGLTASPAPRAGVSGSEIRLEPLHFWPGTTLRTTANTLELPGLCRCVSPHSTAGLRGSSMKQNKLLSATQMLTPQMTER